MSSAWHWFVVAGTLGSLAFFLYLLFANRRTSSDATTGHAYDGIEEYDNPLPMWWVWMFVATIVFALGYLLYYPGLGNFDGVANWSSSKALEEAQAAHEERFAPLYAEMAALTEAEMHASRRAMQVGRRLFINNCSTCHGVNARGAPGFPDLADEQWLWGSDFEQVRATITHGRQATMPSWQGALGDEGVAEVTQHVLKLSGREHDPQTAERGAARYRSFCSSCHGPQGQGNQALGAPDLTNDIWLYGGTPQHIAETIRHGRSGRMPPFDDVLGDDKIHVLSGYVTSLAEE